MVINEYWHNAAFRGRQKYVPGFAILKHGDSDDIFSYRSIKTKLLATKIKEI